MAPKTCTVSVTDANGSRHSVDVLAESLYEAAALGLKLLRDADWVDTPGPMTRLQLQVQRPTVTHEVTIQQLQRWLDGSPISAGTVSRWVTGTRLSGAGVRLTGVEIGRPSDRSTQAAGSRTGRTIPPGRVASLVLNPERRSGEQTPRRCLSPVIPKGPRLRRLALRFRAML